MNKDEEIDWLKDILKIDTTLSNEKEVADYIQQLMDSEGIETQQIEYSKGRNQLIATIKGDSDGNNLGFTGHMDVVPVGVTSWVHQPFAAEENNGKIYARGACDMKGGLMAAIAAMIKIKRSNIKLKGNIFLLATIGEETSAIGAGQLVEEKYVPDLDGLIIAEPTKNRVIIAHKGALWLRFVTKGKTAHGSMPSAGINAVEHMLIFLERFRKEIDFSKNIDELLGCSTSSINIINGGKSTNVIPDACTVEIDIRTIASQQHQDIVERIQNLANNIKKEIPSFDLSIDVFNDLNAVKTDSNSSFVQLVSNVVKKSTGEDIAPGGLSGYTDGSQFVKLKKAFPIIVLGPGITEMAHQPDEYIEIEDYKKAIDIYENIIRAFSC